MFTKLKQILKPENMMFKMVALNCGILLLVTILITTTGNVIYQNSMEKSAFANTMEIQNQVLKSLNLVFESVSKSMEGLGMDPKWFSKEDSGQVQCNIKGQKYNVIYSRSSFTDLIAVGVFDWDKTVQAASQARKVSIYIAVGIAVFAVLCSVMFSASITQPISKLSKLMKKAQTGDLTVRFENHYKGEIHQLGDSFNSMVAKIDELLKLVYQE